MIRAGWFAAGSGLMLVVSVAHLLSEPPTSAEGRALFEAMAAYHPGGIGSSVSFLDVVRVLGAACAILIAVPALHGLSALRSAVRNAERLRGLALWNTVAMGLLAALTTAAGVVPGGIAFTLIAALFAVSLVPRRHSARRRIS